jgi:two-component system, OmpR family, response regulator
MATEATEQAQGPHLFYTMSTTSSLRVLLVEDSALLSARLTELLKRLPEVDLVGTAATEAQALDTIETHDPDVVILDLHLRSGSGFGVLRSLERATRQRPKVIILSNFGLPEYRREAEHYGVEYFLDKSREYFRLPALLSDFARQRDAPQTH